MTMKVGEVKVATIQDFEYFRQLCVTDVNWKQEFHKDPVQVFQQPSTECNFKLLKGRTRLLNVTADTVYDIVMDSVYRKEWDTSMIEGREICQIDSNNDIGYYALKTIAPFQNRDFVTQRSWLDTGSDKIVINHSVFHAKQRRRKNYVRGISYLTGYYIRPLSPTSCEFTYMSHSDPRGYVPAWILNKAVTYLGPHLLQRLTDAAQNYPQWKAKNQPEVKSWRNPEQQTAPPIVWSDIFSRDPDSHDADKNSSREMEVTLDSNDNEAMGNACYAHAS